MNALAETRLRMALFRKLEHLLLNPTPRFAWTAWFSGILLAILIYSFTLTTSPPAWWDEVNLVEFGRLTLSPKTDWAYNLRSDSHRPMFLYAVLGAVAQETGYRLTSPSNAGPRISSITGAVLASGLMVYFLILSGCPPLVSALLGLGLFYDPIFAQSYRGARVDSWAFAFLFLSACAVKRAASIEATPAKRKLWMTAAGAAVAAGLLSWVSFLILTPLLGGEILVSTIVAPGFKLRSHATRWLWLYSLLGFIICAGLVYRIFQDVLLKGWQDAKLLASLEKSHGNGIQLQIRTLLDCFRMNPLVLAAGIAGLLVRRKWMLLLGFVSTLPVIFNTMVYTYRVLYLLPYLFLGLAALFTDRGPAGRLRWWAITVLLFVVGSGAVLTLFVRTVSGFNERAGKDPLLLYRTFERTIGEGPRRVFSPHPELYYAGRALGWRMFRCFDFCADAGPGPDTLRKFLSDFEFVISSLEVQRSDCSAPQFAGGLSPLALGFSHAAVVLPEGGKQARLLGVNFGARSYGPYVVCSRDALPGSR